MIIIFLSIASMLFGSIAAIGQLNLKRLIAYSSIGHMGYALAGLSTGTNQGIQSSVTYITIYLFMNLAFFACILMLRRDDKYFENIEDFSRIFPSLLSSSKKDAITLELISKDYYGVKPFLYKQKDFYFNSRNLSLKNMQELKKY